LVRELALKSRTLFPYTCEDWPGENFAIVKVIEDAFASGRIVLVVAGTRAQDTRTATSLLSQGKLADRTESSVKIVGEVATYQVTPF
jgi:hypothetical protein